MEGFLTFLIFAGLFYVMMRFGCGAHMVHGHGDKTDHKDPVCGMQVDPQQGYGKVLGGRLYRFCSKDCLEKFDQDPEQYLEKGGDAS